MVLNPDALAHWERTFLYQLCNRIKNYGLSLPVAFLTVLAHFLDMAASSKSDSNFDPANIEDSLSAKTQIDR